MNRYQLLTMFLTATMFFGIACKKKQPETLRLDKITAGAINLNLGSPTKDIPVNSTFLFDFSAEIDPLSGSTGISCRKADNTLVPCNISFLNNNKSVKLTPQSLLENFTQYKLILTQGITGSNGESFAGAEVIFMTIVGQLVIKSITVNQQDFQIPKRPKNIDYKSVHIVVTFSDSLDPANYQNSFSIWPAKPVTYSLSGDHKTVNISNNAALGDFSRTYLNIAKELTAMNGASFDGFNNYFYTALDSTPKFPIIPDDQLLTLIQEKTFRYFYDYAHPACGMTRERDNSGDIVTMGGSGFGVMALIVGMERGFITRDQGLTRLTKILTFLETCDRYHGVWPHWINGTTGKTIAFSTNDNGADLVETSYMVEGLMTMHQYLDAAVPAEQTLAGRIDVLTDAVEYDWFTRGQNVLYWHWSPNLGWVMNMQIRGYNEALITYVVAATSTTHPITAAVYTSGYAQNGSIRNGSSYFGYKLPLGEPYGGPLFFTHYSFLGLDPRTLQDQYANYREQNVNQSLINWSWCAGNSRGWVGYSTACWGLTASDDPWGYDAHSPTNDLGVITPSAAVSAIAYSPEQSMKAIRFFYYTIGDRLWGDYGFYDAFDPSENWWASSYLAIDQGPIICMIENHRSGLLWNLFMSHPKVNAGLTKLGFTH
ncbi:MAG: glucoamylase family protein [Bacteroidota bacterium]